MTFENSTIKEFADILAAKTSVPGGGGASAYVGALGAALGSMVAVFTLGKEKYATVEKDVTALYNAAEELRGEFLRLVDRDAEVFEPLGKAYAIPKDDPKRDAIMENCLRDACSVPLEVCRLSARAIELHRAFADKGSVLMISDAATGVMFCLAALYGGTVNVKVNTRLMKDRGYAENAEAEVEKLLEQYVPAAEQIYKDVCERLKK